jgi:hypothetical protein
MKALLTLSAAIEAATGFALLLAPALVAVLLLGTWVDAPAAQVVARIAGAGLLALGVACWFARGAAGRAARGMVTAMLAYNVATVVILTYAALALGYASFILWSAVIVHKVLAIWCIVCLWMRQLPAADPA